MKTTTLIISIVFILLISGSTYAQGNLDIYLKTAAENNPGLKAKFNDYLSVVEKAPQIGTIPDPVIAFGYFISPVETRVGPQQFVISAAQTFPWFGKLSTAEGAVIELANSKLEVFEDARSKLFYDVKSAYFNLYFVQKGIDITRENIEILFTFKQLALIKLEAGKASAVDELRVEMEIADLEDQLAYLLDSQYQLQIQFNNLLNVDNQSEIVIPTVLWNDDLAYSHAQLMDSITANNHSLKQIEHRILSWENQEASARKTGGPSFSIGLDYINVKKSSNPSPDTGENGKDAFLAKVGISIPLYRRKYDGLVQEATYQIEAASFEKTDRVNQLNTLFELGYRDFKDGDRRIALYNKQLGLAAKALDILLAEYSTDGQNFEEVLRMERKVLKYELELDKARADNNAAVAFIDYLLGN